jgi:hypothetical protein
MHVVLTFSAAAATVAGAEYFTNARLNLVPTLLTLPQELDWAQMRLPCLHMCGNWAIGLASSGEQSFDSSKQKRTAQHSYVIHGG